MKPPAWSATPTAKVLTHTGDADLHGRASPDDQGRQRQTGSDTCAWPSRTRRHGSAGHQRGDGRLVPNTVTGSVLTGAGADTASRTAR